MGVNFFALAFIYMCHLRIVVGYLIVLFKALTVFLFVKLEVFQQVVVLQGLHVPKIVFFNSHFVVLESVIQMLACRPNVERVSVLGVLA